MMNPSRSGRPGSYRPAQRDAKSRSMLNRFSKIDEDIVSRYDYDDEGSALSDLPPPYTPYVRDRKQDGTQFARRGGGVYGSVMKQLLNRRETATTKATNTGSGRREQISKIIVKDASRSGKDHVLRLLADSVDGFYPIAPHMNNGNLEFHIIDFDVADALRSMSRRISDKNNPNFKYPIIVAKEAAPFETLSFETRQTIQEVVKRRYNAVTASIDLSDFGNDKVFTDKKLRCHLFNNAVMVVISNYVGENFAQLVRGISLKNNRLRSLDYVSSLVYTLPGVVELDLSSNALARVEELERISGWLVERIHLENNQFTSNYANANTYTSAIHEYLPRVTYLDGGFVTPDGFRIFSEEGQGSLSSLPRYKLGMCSGDEASKKLAESFLTEFLGLYDGPDGEQTRKRLMEAYDERATFTYSIQILRDPPQYVSKGDDDVFQAYIRSSHNILKEAKWGSYREKVIHKGAMDIAVALSKLPLTLHVKDSFVLDFNLMMSNLMVFTLQGVFKDGKEAFNPSSTDCKFFVRNFAVVPRGDSTMAIISDILTITPINIGRLGRFNTLLKKAKEVGEHQAPAMMQISAPPPTPQPSSSSSLMMSSMALLPQQPQMAPGSSSSILPIKQETDADREAAVVTRLSQFTGMKPEWARKCLVDCAWDYERAAATFQQVRANIPAEAFY